MDIKISFNPVGPGIDPNKACEILDKAGDNLFDNYQEKIDYDIKGEIWASDVSDLLWINKIKSEIQKYLPLDGQIQELIGFDDLPVSWEHDWYLAVNFIDDASRAEITHHTDSVATCSACGNKYQDHRFVPAIDTKKLPARPKLMSFFANLKIFCRPKFRERYERSGLTGLSFIDWDEKDKHGVSLYLVSVRSHKWQNRDGVCDKCEMKTNMTTPWAIFNIREQFKYDIQFIRTFDNEDGCGAIVFVLSRRALEFFRDSSIDKPTQFERSSIIYPIRPGYLEEIVWPEPKLFANGKIPLHMLRSSWEKK